MPKDVKKVVLAYSGGLDTSAILKWLQTTYGCEVVTFTADLGQGEELAPARDKALLLGIKPENIFIEDLREETLRLGETRIDARQCELLEALPEYALPPVKRDHLRVGGEAVECRSEGTLRNPLCGRFARERRDERVEITTAGRGEHR